MEDNEISLWISEMFYILWEEFNQGGLMVEVRDHPKDLSFSLILQKSGREPYEWKIKFKWLGLLCEELRCFFSTPEARHNFPRNFPYQINNSASAKKLKSLIKRDFYLCCIDLEWIAYIQNLDAQEKRKTYEQSIEFIDNGWNSIITNLDFIEATHRSRQLLLMFLNAEQRLELLQHDYFFHYVGDKKIKIGKRGHEVYQNDELKYGFCININQTAIPIYDSWLAIKMLLDTDESKLWEIAHKKPIYHPNHDMNELVDYLIPDPFN